MRIVINSCYGGFGLSKEALKMLGIRNAEEIERNNYKLIEVVETLGEEANACHAQLKIVEIPDGIEWVIGEYDGIEHVAEKHRIWR